MCAHKLVEFAFAGVAKRRMTDIVNQAQRFGQFAVQPERGGDRACYLCDFERVGKAITEVIGIASCKNLSLSFQAAKGSRVDNPVAVPGIFCSIEVPAFREAATA